MKDTLFLVICICAIYEGTKDKMHELKQTEFYEKIFKYKKKLKKYTQYNQNNKWSLPDNITIACDYPLISSNHCILDTNNINVNILKVMKLCTNLRKTSCKTEYNVYLQKFKLFTKKNKALYYTFCNAYIDFMQTMNGKPLINFLPFNRYFLYLFENEIRRVKGCENFTFPYSQYLHNNHYLKVIAALQKSNFDTINSMGLRIGFSDAIQILDCEARRELKFLDTKCVFKHHFWIYLCELDFIWSIWDTFINTDSIQYYQYYDSGKNLTDSIKIINNFPTMPLSELHCHLNLKYTYLELFNYLKTLSQKK